MHNEDAVGETGSSKFGPDPNVSVPTHSDQLVRLIPISDSD